MNCNTARSLLPYSRVPGELAPDDAAELSRHLTACSACAALALHEEEFDRSVSRAMKAVVVPADLRERIGTRLAQETGRIWRRNLLRGVATAAAVLLVVSLGLGWWNSKSAFLPEQFIQDADHNYILVVNGSRESADEFFRRNGLRTGLPEDFDYSLVSNLMVVEFAGKNVARLDFQRGAARAVVYVLPKREFRLPRDSSREVAGSQCSVEVVDSSSDYIFVIVYMAGGQRQMFLPQAVVG